MTTETASLTNYQNKYSSLNPEEDTGQAPDKEAPSDQLAYQQRNHILIKIAATIRLWS